MASFGAQRDADANFMSALRDAISNHAINSDGGQHQRERRKYAEQGHIELAHGHCARAHLLHSTNVSYADGMVNSLKLLLDIVAKRHWIRGSADNNVFRK